jgi:hypothetical protein
MPVDEVQDWDAVAIVAALKSINGKTILEGKGGDCCFEMAV